MPQQETTHEELEARLAEAEALIKSLRSQGVDDLEEQVEARTIQLAAVNRELQREIGEHLKTQERIRLLSSAVEQSSEGIAVADPGGNLLFVNEAFARIHGYEQDELVGKHLRVFHTDEQMPAVERANRVLRDTGEFSGEIWHVRRDGQVFPTLMQNSLLRDESGTPVGMIGTLRDVTEMKRTEEALRVKDFAIGSSINALSMADLKGKLTYVNDAFLRLWGYETRQELLGTHATSFWEHEQEAAQVIEHIRVHGTWLGEMTGRKKSGDLIELSLAANMISNANGEPIGMMGSFVDVTDRKRAQEQLRELEKELAHLGRLSTMGEMAAGIAHELKQPLSAITNYATGSTWHLQKATADPQDLTDVMEKISAHARHASDIIDRLRSSVRKCEPCRSSTDINQLLADVLKLVEHELRQESVSVRLDLQDELPLVFADAIQIQQVALNLIRNATDATRGMSLKEKQLTLATSVADGETVEVSVCDTGTGLSEEVRRKIFDAYFTTKAEGLGMGLAISQTIVEAHGGRIWATPNSPQGTVFRFVIPTVPKAD